MMQVFSRQVWLCKLAILGFLLNSLIAYDAAAKEPATINVAVMNLQAEEGASESIAKLMSDILRTELYNTGKFTVMNREDMDAILKEVAFQQSGACDETSCIVEMGQALGVGKMVAGSLGVIGDKYVLNVKLINVATMQNEVLVTKYHPVVSRKGPEMLFRNAAQELARQGGGKGRPLMQGSGGAGSFSIVFRAGKGFGASARNNTPVKVSGKEGAVSYSSITTLTETEIFTTNIALGVRYFPTNWLQIEANYLPLVFEGEGQANSIFGGDTTCSDCGGFMNVSVSSTVAISVAASFVKPLGRKFKGTFGFGILFMEMDIGQGTQGSANSAQFQNGTETVILNNELIVGKDTEDSHALRSFGFLRFGTEWRPQERLGLGLNLDWFLGPNEIEVFSSTYTDFDSIDARTPLSIVTYKFSRVVAGAELAFYF